MANKKYFVYDYTIKTIDNILWSRLEFHIETTTTGGAVVEEPKTVYWHAIYNLDTGCRSPCTCTQSCLPHTPPLTIYPLPISPSSSASASE